MRTNTIESRSIAQGESREQAHARAAKARAAYQRKQVRESIVLAPFKFLLIAANIALVPVMVLVGVAMVLLATVFIVAAMLRPFVRIAGIIVTIVGIVQIVGGGNWVTLIVGVVLLWLSTSKVTFSKS